MEQIIWALNSFHNQTTDLISYLREYASQYLESAYTGLKKLSNPRAQELASVLHQIVQNPEVSEEWD